MTHTQKSDDLRQRLDRLKRALQDRPADIRSEDWVSLAEESLKLAALLEQQNANMDRSLRKLAFSQRIANRRLQVLEQSLTMSVLRRLGGPLLAIKAKAGQALLHSRFHHFYLKMRPPRADQSYERWAHEREASRQSLGICRKRAEEFAYRPVFSVIMPVHHPERAFLEAAVRSVSAQVYPCWELCVCDDASPAWVEQFFRESSLPRNAVSFTRSEEHLGISGALNRALELARGDYCVFLDQDDVLAPRALFEVAKTLNASRAELLYSDEDLIDANGGKLTPIFKPDWSPDLLLSCMYLCHLLVVSRQAIQKAGGFRSEFDGAQDYDLALRLTDEPAAVVHIPEVLYHWRMHKGSTAGDGRAKPEAQAAGKRALDEALSRRGWSAVVHPKTTANVYDVQWKADPQPKASVIICSRSAKLLKQCLDSISKKTAYDNREIVVVQHIAGDQSAMERLLGSADVQRVRYEGVFDFSRMNNMAAASARGEVLVFLNDDIEVLDASWLERLVGQASRPDVGVVGARLLYPSGALQHAGMAIGIHDGCGHPGRGAFSWPYWRWNEMTRNVSAVTGACLAIRKELFLRLGGFDETFPVNYNDVDLCMRVRKAGFHVVYDADVVLRHHESLTRKGGVTDAERERWYERWPEELDSPDPYYSPHLNQMGEDAGLSG